jgi:transcriptional regulator with XRE-family HTH domain
MEGMVPHDRVIPAVRLEFAKRLRQLRIEKGFAHARDFARALDIEENRYTRYERAEAEPSFTLIHRICVTLQVSPNDLFGFTGSVP